MGTGTIVWQARELLAAGEIDEDEYMDIVSLRRAVVGHCNTMGTALDDEPIAEALGMRLPGCAAIPAPYRGRSADRLRHRTRGRARWCTRICSPRRS